MASTERRPRSLDKALPTTGGGAIVPPGSGAPPAGPGFSAPGAPQNVRIAASVLLFSAVTPSAGVTVAWSPPLDAQPDSYLVQWATTNTFTSPTARVAARDQLSIALDGLPVNTLVYVRVAARVQGVQGAWSVTTSTTTPADTTAPAAPTTLGTAWSGADGGLRITWSNPTSPNLRDVRVRIFASNGGTLLTEDYSASGAYLWTRGQNLTATSGSADPSVYIVLTARSWGGVLSTTDLTGTATLAVPANVSGATATWDGATGTCRFAWTAVAAVAGYQLTIDGQTRTVIGAEYVYTLSQNSQEHSGTPDPALSWSLVAVDALGQVSATPASGTATLARPATPASTAHNWTTGADVASEDWTLTWTQAAGITGYRLTIDTLARDLPLSSRYHYPFAQNAVEHSGTADPVLSWSLVAVDALGQTSTTPASGTATNAAPPAPTGVTLTQTFSGFLVEVAATRPADLLAYRFRIIQTSPSASDVTVDDPAPFLARVVATPATYQVAARMVDRFGQAGTETLSATLLVDALTLAILRERLAYSDSQATAAATLKTAMSDDVRGSGGVSYALNAGWARWVRADWQLRERIKTITLAIAPTSGTTTWYIRTSNDGTTWSYFSGPLVATGATGQSTTLTAQASEANAQANAVSSATLGNSTNARVDLPSLQECRYIELWLRNTAAASRVDEFYPRRLIQADDIEAERIRAFHISAGAITTDKLTVPGTASLDSSLRLIAFRVPVSLDLDSGIYQGTGTFASPTTGLKLWNSGGIGRLATYNAGTLQVELDSSGRLAWANGAGIADATGIRLGAAAGGSLLAANAYRFTSGNNNLLGMYSNSGGAGLSIQNDMAAGGAANGAVISIYARGNGTSGGIPFAGSVSLWGVATGVLDQDAIVQVESNQGVKVSTGSGRGLAVGQFMGSGFAVAPYRFQVTDGNSLMSGSLDVTGGLNLGSATGATTGQIRASAGAYINGAGADANIGLSVRSVAGNAGLRVTSGAGTALVTVYDDGSVDAGNVLSINGGGRVANQAVRIRSHTDTTASYPLVVSSTGGSVMFSLQGFSTTQMIGFLRDTAWSYSSDDRLKDSIVDEADGLAQLRRLRPIRFRYSGSPRLSRGFSAQEVQAVFPDLVTQMEDGTLALRTTDLIPVILKALVDLAATVETLRRV